MKWRCLAKLHDWEHLIAIYIDGEVAMCMKCKNCGLGLELIKDGWKTRWSKTNFGDVKEFREYPKALKWL